MNDTVRRSQGGEGRRGRPRGFCTEEALDAAEELFAKRGYEGVGVAELCRVMGIRPPSFYAAFGSKAGCFAKAVERYAAGRGGAVLRDIMVTEPDPRRGIPAMLLAAADAYTDGVLGCFIMEGARGTNDAEAVESCHSALTVTASALRDYVASTSNDPARTASLVLTALTGLSGSARQGGNRVDLRAFAQLAGDGIVAQLD